MIKFPLVEILTNHWLGSHFTRYLTSIHPQNIKRLFTLVGTKLIASDR